MAILNRRLYEESVSTHIVDCTDCIWCDSHIQAGQMPIRYLGAVAESIHAVFYPRLLDLMLPLATISTRPIGHDLNCIEARRNPSLAV